MTESTRTPLTLCWHCDRALDAATEVEGQGRPEPGAVSLCLYCGAVAVFGPDLRLERPSKDLLDELWDDSDEFRKTFVKFCWARQFVMITESLMRPQGEGPDR